MKKIVLVLLVVFICSNPAYSQTEVRKSPDITIYNGDLGVVRETRPLDLKQGITEISIVDIPENIIPTSVKLQFDGSILEQNFQYDLVSIEKVLKKYIGKEVELTGKNTIRGKLLSVSYDKSLLLQKNDGGLVVIPKTDDYTLSMPSLPVGFITVPTLTWSIESAKTGKQDGVLSYMTNGMNWQAEYVVLLNDNDTKMDINAWVNITNNSGMSFENANLKLVAGDINMTDRRRLKYNMYDMYDQDAIGYRGPEMPFKEKNFFEYHVYDLQRKTDVKNNETKQISLFEAKNVNISKKYVYSTGKKSNNDKVKVIIEFDNKKENKMGMPLPGGTVRVSKYDGKSVEFIGEDRIEHTPKDEKIALKIGEVFDIVAETVEMEHNIVGESSDEVSYEVKLRNRKGEKVVVEVEANLGENWLIIDPSEKYEKKNASTAVFKVSVGKDEEKVLKYKVRFNY